ncbi:hypothetical protein [Pseudomonas serbica]|uniref:hypothetical protein n=1 Tax=Pseudomonas serbica TaxID=2965074 RepID=UPI00237AFB94|nr:hypothetical protein [Pseudomonas serbica]
MQWHIIHSVTLEKPVMGDPCNGCGVCCIAKVCEIGVELGDDVNCKALMQSTDGSFECGMVVDPYRFMAEDELETWKAIDDIGKAHQGELALKKLHADMLGAGRGCDSDDDAVQEYIEEALAREKSPPGL